MPVSNHSAFRLGSYSAIQMEINNILQRLVKATKNLLRPNVPRSPMSTTLSFEDLNADIILEIFSYYVSSQTDGPFILTRVSTSWRDFVLQSPVLWQWIIIDEHSPDWIEKAHLCAALSGACPLQIVMPLPMAEPVQLNLLLLKCQNLFFEIPDDMTGEDVKQETERLFKVFNEPLSCKLHYHRAGEYLLQEERRILSVDFSTERKLEFAADGSELPNYHHSAQTRDLEHGDAYYSRILLKVCRLLDILRNASHLRTLILSHRSMDPILSDLDLPVVNLVSLAKLQINDIDYKRNGSLVPFAQSIQCPNLSTLVLYGHYDDVIDITGRLGVISNPSNLEFTFKYDYGGVIRAPSFKLPSVSHLIVQCEDTENGFSWEDEDLESAFGSAMLIANIASVLRVTLPPESTTWFTRDSDTVVECVRHASDTQHRCRCDGGPQLRLPPRKNLTEIDIRELECLIYHSSSTPYSITAEMSFPLLTTISCSPYVLLPLLTQHSMPVLTTIQLYTQQERDKINRVGLVGEEYFDEEITDWVIRHVDSDLPLKIHTFGLSWFPKWTTLLRMLYHMAIHSGDGHNLTIKLPAYPHYEIQTSLKLALAGVDDGMTLFRHSNESPMPEVLVKGKQSDVEILRYKRTCYYCWSSGRHCNRDSGAMWGSLLFCGLHSQTDLVSLTKDTVVEVEE